MGNLVSESHGAPPHKEDLLILPVWRVKAKELVCSLHSGQNSVNFAYCRLGGLHKQIYLKPLSAQHIFSVSLNEGYSRTSAHAKKGKGWGTLNDCHLYTRFFPTGILALMFV